MLPIIVSIVLPMTVFQKSCRRRAASTTKELSKFFAIIVLLPYCHMNSVNQFRNRSDLEIHNKLWDVVGRGEEDGVIH